MEMVLAQFCTISEYTCTKASCLFIPLLLDVKSLNSRDPVLKEGRTLVRNVKVPKYPLLMIPSAHPRQLDSVIPLSPPHNPPEDATGLPGGLTSQCHGNCCHSGFHIYKQKLQHKTFQQTLTLRQWGRGVLKAGDATGILKLGTGLSGGIF